MGLMEKLKNIFFEEEYVEVEEDIKEEKKREKPIAKKIETVPSKNTKVENDEYYDEEILEQEDTAYLDKDVLKTDNNFKFPMILEEDFIEEEKPKVEEAPRQEKATPKPYGNYEYKKDEYQLYTRKPEMNKGFKPSPIISPIYGVLDKNYKKEEIVSKKDIKVSSYASSKVDLDSVRAKAYGSLENDIVNSFEEEQEEVEEDNVADNLLVDMSEADTPVVDKVTIGDALEYFEDLGLEYNVDYKEHRKEKVGRRSSRADLPHEEETNDEEQEEVTIDDNDVELQDVTIEDNLFDLIDSMYEDKE